MELFLNLKRFHHKRSLPGWNEKLWYISYQRKLARQAWSNAGRSPNGALWHNVRFYNKLFRESLKEQKRSSKQNVANKMNLAKIQNDSAGVFRPIKQKNERAALPPIIFNDGKAYTGIDEQLLLWDSHFRSIFSQISLVLW